jgi:ankyrin repeat protein
MIQPPELQLHLPMHVGAGQVATTTQVWLTLQAAHEGHLEKLQELAAGCPGLVYAQYNYAPPIHFAVREGHMAVVRYLLEQGAHDPAYLFYPFQESLQTMALDRGHEEIARLLDEYASAGTPRYGGDNGNIDYGRTPLQKEFEKAVAGNQLETVRSLLAEHPEFALDNTYFWSEGVLTMPVKKGFYEMADLLIRYGARVPRILKWTQFYYFETYAHAEFILARGMDPNVMSWQHVTLLHDLAQKGLLDKAELLLRYGAELDPVDEQYQSTPLGLAARWGQAEMVRFLLEKGADPHKAGAPWATPLRWAERKGHPAVISLLKQFGA